jgi:predicted Zn-dependent protease with MMP-like domain
MPSPFGTVVSGPRPGRMRDRRGRGARGPMALPGPLSPQSVPYHRTPRQLFDALVGDILASLEQHFATEPDHVDVVVEEAPLLPAEWSEDVPGSTVVRSAVSSRVVLYRLPITQRCSTPAQLADAVWQIVLDRLAEVWQVSPDDLDPR